MKREKAAKAKKEATRAAKRKNRDDLLKWKQSANGRIDDWIGKLDMTNKEGRELRKKLEEENERNLPQIKGEAAINYHHYKDRPFRQTLNVLTDYAVDLQHMARFGDEAKNNNKFNH